uniref:NYN domain-containing protein n=1 Tax=Chromera velia CCMP2878 TaxID=1169474 RepID=A0A0G4EYN4_9ALVE|eukprot:Cvel_14303.t1-p1 / transcript=Cvel_14303.t1 / gene=Cvel_14303 / organism=Chromera_velia_CCMP2878 / gene_product=hypothetical protein / transcript_product=hypothetical protein / location=Cvel_scaffold1011:12333-13058(-) / protein_length=242 / sequence_SO=supercontig / SO=protein_coding / is_pseudo=false
MMTTSPFAVAVSALMSLLLLWDIENVPVRKPMTPTRFVWYLLHYFFMNYEVKVNAMHKEIPVVMSKGHYDNPDNNGLMHSLLHHPSMFPVCAPEAEQAADNYIRNRLKGALLDMPARKMIVVLSNDKGYAKDIVPLAKAGLNVLAIVPSLTSRLGGKLLSTVNRPTMESKVFLLSKIFKTVKTHVSSSVKSVAVKHGLSLEDDEQRKKLRTFCEIQCSARRAFWRRRSRQWLPKSFEPSSHQ